MVECDKCRLVSHQAAAASGLLLTEKSELLRKTKKSGPFDQLEGWTKMSNFSIAAFHFLNPTFYLSKLLPFRVLDIFYFGAQIISCKDWKNNYRCIT